MAFKNPLVLQTTFATYTATEIIGEGGAGRVYRAVDDTGQSFAIKLLNSGKATKDRRKRFQNELQFCSRNRHPNIVPVLDHGILPDARTGCPFYVMPLYPSSLRTLLSAKIAHDRVLTYFGQLLDGVEAAHLQRVIHRDLKPENILYDSAVDRLVIADFGIARFEEEELFTAVETSPNDRLANFQYAAPEQRARGAVVDHRADIYAIGLILNEMFTGEVPWGTAYKSIASIAPDVAYLDELVSSMLRQSPGDRPSTIEHVKQNLIGHKQEFIVRQRISELKEIVIPVTDLDDPLVLDPPRLVNYEYVGRTLTLFLHRPVNDTWVWALQHMGNYTSPWNKGPEAFRIVSDRAMISADVTEVQEIIDYFKGWLPNANQVYAEKIRRENQEAEVHERLRLQKQIEEQERRERILKNIKV